MSQQQATLFLFSLPFSDSTESENTLSLQRCQDKVLKHVWQNKEQKEKIFPSRRAKTSINAAWWLFSLTFIVFVCKKEVCWTAAVCLPSAVKSFKMMILWVKSRTILLLPSKSQLLKSFVVDKTKQIDSLKCTFMFLIVFVTFLIFIVPKCWLGDRVRTLWTRSSSP